MTKIEYLEIRIEKLKAENEKLKAKKCEIILPKITQEMVDYLFPELIESTSNGGYTWNQIAVDASSFFEIRSR